MFRLNQDTGSQGAKWDGSPDEEVCGTGKHGGIRVNFIPRWKQCLFKDLSDDLQKNCVFISGLEQCSNGIFFYGSRIPHGPVFFQNHIQRKYTSETNGSF